MAGYVVIAPCVVIGDVYLYRDATVPAHAPKEAIQHLLDMGLIAKVKEAPAVVPDAAASQENPTGAEEGGVADLSKMTVADLTEYAAMEGIDLGGAKKRADILAVIEKAEADAAQADAGEPVA